MNDFLKFLSVCAALEKAPDQIVIGCDGNSYDRGSNDPGSGFEMVELTFDKSTSAPEDPPQIMGKTVRLNLEYFEKKR